MWLPLLGFTVSFALLLPPSAGASQCVCVCVCLSVCLWLWLRLRLWMWMWMWLCVCVLLFCGLSLCVFMCVCVCVCVCVRLPLCLRPSPVAVCCSRALCLALCRVLIRALVCLVCPYPALCSCAHVRPPLRVCLAHRHTASPMTSRTASIISVSGMARRSCLRHSLRWTRSWRVGPRRGAAQCHNND